MPLSFDYSSRYVVFVDILGFKDKVVKIEKHLALFELLIELPAIVAKTLEMANNIFGATVDTQGTAFSDSIVFSAAASQPAIGLYTVTNATVTLCQQLLHRSALARGGLAKGLCHHKDGIVFGQGMIDAYLLEQNVAKMPRVVVTPDVAKEWQDTFGRPGGLVALKDLITRDTDGVDLVDLFHFPKRDSIDNTTFAFFKESGPDIRALLDEPGLGAREREKIAWMARKYNAAHMLTRLSSPRINI